MRRFLFAITSVAVIGLSGCATTGSAPSASSASNSITTALADAGRPDADRARDSSRKPFETLSFMGIKPGSKVAELVPGQGYFTRILSIAVGPAGKVYAFVPDELTKRANRPPTVAALTTEPRYANVAMVLKTLPQFSTPEPVDVVFTAQNYHDLYNKFLGPADVGAVNRAIYRSLKPGGVYLIIDHSGRAGSGSGETETLHRIEAARVRADVEAAGFVFDGQGVFLANPNDARNLPVFDPAIRGASDQFAYRFRKPRNAR